MEPEENHVDRLLALHFALYSAFIDLVKLRAGDKREKNIGIEDDYPKLLGRVAVVASNQGCMKNGGRTKDSEETVGYVKCMSQNGEVPVRAYLRLSSTTLERSQQPSRTRSEKPTGTESLAPRFREWHKNCKPNHGYDGQSARFYGENKLHINHKLNHGYDSNLQTSTKDREEEIWISNINDIPSSRPSSASGVPPL
ncbi:hypothetical protein L218DRAFT_949450 [Marasmius fiardii PR-910]|nr:hypothetical protein L218DRAFT_949450 [Marasmius fiardii PR-910]